ncbi:MAG: DUF983 domain-containing protein [Bacteroidota bacterium]|nr:DUF983 domain-containing protein [Bacteroidota bacterium]MDX5431098.1 DUF983 domain-containing protein [Bacteroidota bacterium]
MFTHSVFNPGKFQQMHQHCPVCGINFEPETGFYWGAMYISYAVTVAMSVTIGVAMRVLLGPDININYYIFTIIGAMILLAPVSFRVSRAIMLHFISPIKYDPNFEWDDVIHEDKDVIS